MLKVQRFSLSESHFEAMQTQDKSYLHHAARIMWPKNLTTHTCPEEEHERGKLTREESLHTLTPSHPHTLTPNGSGYTGWKNQVFSKAVRYNLGCLGNNMQKCCHSGPSAVHTEVYHQKCCLFGKDIALSPLRFMGHETSLVCWPLKVKEMDTYLVTKSKGSRKE